MNLEQKTALTIALLMAECSVEFEKDWPEIRRAGIAHGNDPTDMYETFKLLWETGAASMLTVLAKRYRKSGKGAFDDL